MTSKIEHLFDPDTVQKVYARIEREKGMDNVKRRSADKPIKFLCLSDLKSKGIIFSRMHIYRLMAAGEFPESIPVGKNRVAWVEAEIDEWMNKRVSARIIQTSIERKDKMVLSAPENTMERRMDWEPWFNGPRMPMEAMIFALKSDYSGVDLLYRHAERKGQTFNEWLCFATGERVPDETIYCAYIIAPPRTPKYKARTKIKAVK